ncbi:MAG: hypothetical protein LBD45_08180, partial [Bacteroidales bacterium]|nr:hypothetical protein [Bacteroidales bacterium]
LNPDAGLRDSHSPIDARAGIRSSALPNWFFNAYARYRKTKNEHYYFRDLYGTAYPSIGVIFPSAFDCGYYSKNDLLQFGGRISFNYPDNELGFSLQLEKNFWNVSFLDETRIFDENKAINVPDFRLDATININLLSQLKTSIGYEWQNNRYHLDNYSFTKMADIHNLMFGASYVFSRTFSVYLQLNNIMNWKYEYWHTYPELGFSGLAGLTVVF